MFVYFSGLINAIYLSICGLLGFHLIEFFFKNYHEFIKFILIALIVFIANLFSTGIMTIIDLKKDESSSGKLLITKYFQEKWYEQIHNEYKLPKNLCRFYWFLVKDFGLMAIAVVIISILYPICCIIAYALKVLCGKVLNPFTCEVEDGPTLTGEVLFTFSPIWFLLPTLFFLGQGGEQVFDSNPQVFVKGFKWFLIVFWAITMIALAKALFIITETKLITDTNSAWSNKIAPVISASYYSIKNSICPLLGSE